MEVAPLDINRHDNSFLSFSDILDTVKDGEGDESADDTVSTSDEADDNISTSDNDPDDEIFYEHLETLFDNNCKDVILRKGSGLVDADDNNKYKQAGHTDSSRDIQKPNNYQCLECPKSFPTRYKLNRHLNTHSKTSKQKGKSTNECGVCKKIFRDKNGLVHHMFIHTGEQPYECGDCGKRFRLKGSLKEHRINRHDPKKFKCSICEKSFSQLFYMSQHMNIHNGVRFPCTICNKTFSAAGTLKTHMKLHNSPTITHVTCNICEKAFTSEVNLKLHMEIHEGTQTLVCNVCDARFSRKADLKRHVHIHTGEKPHKCSLCPKAFRQPGNLGRHMAWHRGDYTCKYCGRRYSRKDELLRHIYTHEKELDIHETSLNKSLQCEHCHKFFSNEIKLQMHLEIHKRKSIKYTCTECGTVLSNNSNYYRHMREKHEIHLKSDTQPNKVHSHEKVEDGPFDCDLCSKICKNKRALTEHVNFVHLKTASHVCDVCDMGFHRRRDLRKHQGSKHDIQTH